MDLEEILRTIGALYLKVYLRAEILQGENAILKAQIEEFKKRYEPPPEDEKDEK